MAVRIQDVENQMVLPLRKRPIELFCINPIMCDCSESKAIMKINGNPRCKWCAEDEGVILL